MAVLRFFHSKEDPQRLVEQIEIRVWGPAGRENQPFYIGSGLNFNARYNVWLEIIHSLNGAQIFYTRTFLHIHSLELHRKLLERFRNGEYDLANYADPVFSLPQTDICLERKKITYEDRFGKEVTSIHYNFRVFADTGAVLCSSSPGVTGVEIKLDWVDFETGFKFMCDLDNEINDSFTGKRPDPAGLAAGSSVYTFARQLNQKAYDLAAADYQEDYFESPRLVQMFDDWLKMVPAGGHVLDAGCGHGDPIITRLLERGMRVTGSDFSPAMLARARARFTQVEFLQRVLTDIDEENIYDAACSFNSVLYQDPIDLLLSIYRLWCALKPGGLLFLFTFDSHPSWRGQPILKVINQQMWSWTYSKEEAKKALQEHGYFKVLDLQDLTTEEDKLHWLEARRKDEKKVANDQEAQENEDDFVSPVVLPNDLPYYFAIIARKRKKKLSTAISMDGLV